MAGTMLGILFVAATTYNIFDTKKNEINLKREKQEQTKISSNQKVGGIISELSSEYSEDKKKSEIKKEEEKKIIQSSNKITPPITTIPRPPVPIMPNRNQLNQITEEEKEELQAKKSDINFKIKSTEPATDKKILTNTINENNIAKKENIRFYNSGQMQMPLSEYEIKAGTIIPCTLITEINSDLAGDVVAQIRENVYDTVTGNKLLIPQFAKVIGIYDNNILYGQNRVLIIWQRIIFPDGQSLFLDNMQGIDLTGKVGFRDKTNKHSSELIKGIVLSSLLAAASSMATGNNSRDDSFSASAGRGASEAIVELGGKITQKNLDRQPTIEIRQGFQFNIFIHSDLKMEKVYE